MQAIGAVEGVDAGLGEDVGLAGVGQKWVDGRVKRLCTWWIEEWRSREHKLAQRWHSRRQWQNGEFL